MNELTTTTPAELTPAGKTNQLGRNELIAITQSADNIVNSITSCINNVANTSRDIAMISAQIEVENIRLNHTLDCFIEKAKKDLQIYRDTLPLLDKNFSSMQARMDRLMDRAMDLISDDVSDESLARQQAIMNLIELTNDSINKLTLKLLPN